MSEAKECRHILTTGRRCSSPALRDKAYCYFHFRTRARHALPPSGNPTPDNSPLILHPLRADALGQPEPTVAAPPTQPLTLVFPALEDRESIQVAASMIVSALGRNQLDGKRAATMLYGLQVAAAVTRFDVEPDKDYFVEVETEPAPDGGDLALP